MGNKNAIPLKALQTEDQVCVDGVTEAGDAAPSLSSELLASLQTLGDNSDYTLLPHSLHQIAEAFCQKEDYQVAIQFLQLEKVYHERLLSNLTALQENWESRWRERNAESSPANAEHISQKHMEALSQICRTHLKPSGGVTQQSAAPDTTPNNTRGGNEAAQSHHAAAGKPETPHQDEDLDRSMNSDPELPSPESGHQEEDEGEDGEEEETYEEGREVEEEEEEEEEEEPCEETPEEEEVKVEWPAGVPQASDKDLAKLSHKEGSSSPDGLVSILKRRRASLDGLPPPSNAGAKPNAKRKVRFSEPEDGVEQDEVGGDSCLILLLLCLVTVVISVGGTALYCTLVDTYSNICTDFSLNVDFYVMNVRRFLQGLRHWLPLWT